MIQLPYIIECSVILAVLINVYYFTMHKTTYYKLNRYYIILMIIISFLLPVMEINFSKLSISGLVVQEANLIIILGSGTIANNLFSFTLLQIVSSVYYLVVAFLSIRFFIGLFKIQKIYQNNKKSESDSYTIIDIKDKDYAFSFFNLIVVNKNNYNKDEYQNIIAHERVHLSEQHSIDMLIIEIAKILMWFNPFVYMLQKLMRENHEFFVDNKVLESTNNQSAYIEMLSSPLSKFKFQPINQFNSANILKRLIMIKKSNSKQIAKLRFLFVVPIIALFIFLFSCNNEKTETIVAKNDDPVQKEDKKYEEVSTLAVFHGGNEALGQFLSKNILYPEEAKKKGLEDVVYIRFIVGKKGEITKATVKKGKYELLNNEALRVVNKLPDFTPATKDGKAVEVEFTIPINFKLK